MAWHSRRDSRKIHRWGGIIIALPFLIVLITGLILQVKKEVAWVQPKSQRGITKNPSINFDEILAVAATVPEAEISSWDDIDRLDVRPSRGIVKVRAENNWEVQIDTKTAEVLQVAFRRSDIIETLHDGSWFHEAAKLWVFLPANIVVLILWITGVYLFLIPYLSKRKNKKRLEELKSAAKK